MYVKPIKWAEAALGKAEVPFSQVMRVFPPIDTSANDVSEVLYLDERTRPRTAYLRADGSVSINTSGW